MFARSNFLLPLFLICFALFACEKNSTDPDEYSSVELKFADGHVQSGKIEGDGQMFITFNEGSKTNEGSFTSSSIDGSTFTANGNMPP
jgi:hypothetical protein